MIYDALKFIQDSFNEYLSDIEDPLSSEAVMVLANIALAAEMGGGEEKLDDKIVMSLVNIQEEASLKNNAHYRYERGSVTYQNPSINLNLYVLFSAVNNNQTYDKSLKRLSRVIEFFQWQKEFAFWVTPPGTGGPPPQSQQVKVYADLYTLTFEQLNHLWGALGGKQVPFVLYKLRVATLTAPKIEGEGAVITELVINGDP
ncbi:MAG: DUF4255 domain-containing protein [Merismopedia sp. SIO2A8]|nr:DUF4255 domain-containing protein [Symploca sp. SIO2B6]NET54125.1 DUF4255 domain-containing protein [Merismopedia sp. SIO2A8]